MMSVIGRIGVTLLLFCIGLLTLASLIGHALPTQGQIAYMALERSGVRLWMLDAAVGVTLPIADHAFTGPPMYPSPDGQQIAFFRETGGDARLHIVNADGTHLRRLEYVSPDLSVAWMPDSHHLRVSSDYGTHDIYDVWTLTAERLPRFEVSGCGLPVLSPDGTRLVMSLAESGGAFFCTSTGISIVNANDGGNFAEFLPDEFDLSAVWAPDSEHLALFGTGGLFIVSDETSDIRQIMHMSFNSSTSAPIWSPDGTKLLLLMGSVFDVHVMSVLPEASEPVNLTPLNSMELYPTWSPDGTQIAFVSSSRGSSEIYTVEVATGRIQRVTTNSMNELNLVWLP